MAENTTRDGNFVPGGSLGIIEQLDLTTKFPQTVAILDGDGNQITSFGGGTQYVNGDTVATPTGTVAMWRQSADNTVQSVADDNPMPVNVATNTGLATSTKQDSQITLETELNALTETLQELVQRLMPLAGAISSTAALRVAPISSVSTAVTGSVTATGPITSAQSIAEKAVAGILFPEKIALTNTASVLSNINNCVAA